MLFRSRAKHCVTILGSSRMLQEMIDNTGENDRYTSLDQRIREIVDAGDAKPQIFDQR